MNIDDESSVFYKAIIGVDPGASGALVALRLGDGVCIADCRFTQVDYKSHEQQANILNEFHLNRGFVFIEDIPTISYRDEVTGHAAAKVHGHSQFWRGVALAHGFGANKRLHMVRASTWQSSFGLIHHGEGGDYEKKKEQTKIKAKKFFPKCRITNANADAYLIAEYGRCYVVKLIKKGLL